MESKPVAIVMALIVLVAAGSVVYYWSKGSNPDPVSGVVVEKTQRLPGSEAGDQPLQQGLRVLSGESAQQELYYILRVKTASGEVVDMQVPADFFAKVKQGDVVQQLDPDAVPTIVNQGGRR